MEFPPAESFVGHLTKKFSEIQIHQLTSNVFVEEVKMHGKKEDGTQLILKILATLVLEHHIRYNWIGAYPVTMGIFVIAASILAMSRRSVPAFHMPK